MKRVTRSLKNRHHTSCFHPPPNERGTPRNVVTNHEDRSKQDHSTKSRGKTRLQAHGTQKHPWHQIGEHTTGNHRHWRWWRICVKELDAIIHKHPHTYSKLISWLGTVMMLIRRTELYSTGTGMALVLNAKKKRRGREDVDGEEMQGYADVCRKRVK